MADMTMGQRIAQERKKLGISQEMLGEKLGVSRQAISKWESDGAVPEIDKIIVLSKLFDVSVGWLLGVEELPQSPEQPDTLSDEQLYLIEEIVKKYQPKPVQLWKLAVIAICLSLTLTTYIYRLQSRIDTMDYVYDSLLAQHIELRSRVQKLEDTMENPAALSLFGDYSFEFLQFSEGAEPWVDIRFHAMPNVWRDGDSAYLTVTREGMETVRMDCTWNGAWLFTTVPLEIADGYQYCVTIVHADGSREQQVVTDEGFQDLETTLAVEIEIGSWGRSTTAVRLTNLEYQVTMPGAVEYGTLSWKSVDLILTAGGEELGRFSLLDAATEQNRDLLYSPTIASTHMEAIVFGDLELPKGEGVNLWLRAELSNGLSAQKPVCSWLVNENGTLRVN